MAPTEPFPPTTLRESIAFGAVHRAVGRTIRRLQALREGHLASGEGNGLRHIWDEVCVQVQDEYSPLWPHYEELIARIVQEEELAGFPATTLHAIWTLTDEGEDWLDREEPSGSFPYGEEEIVGVLTREVIDRAADWSNARIRRRLERD